MSPTSVQSFSLLDGTSIPWLGWGNGTGNASKTAIESGKVALESGILHLDTAQIYHNEKETGEAIKVAGVKREDVYVTSKLSARPNQVPVPLSEARASVQESLDRLGFVPDLYLIHNPYVAEPGHLKDLWALFEALKDEGKLKSIGVSNFRPQDLEVILDGAKYKPVVNQIEYHPYVLTHLAPLLALQEKHGIVSQSYGTLTPTLRHPTGGPLKPILERIAARVSTVAGTRLDASAVLLLWARAQGVVVVTASGNADRIRGLGVLAALPEGLLTPAEVEEISAVGKTVHFRFYTEHLENEFPLPDLPSQ